MCCFDVEFSRVQYEDGGLGAYYLEKGASQRTLKNIYDRERAALGPVSRESSNWG